MADFDPNQYLANQEFNPDAYLAEKQGFNPDAYLAEKGAAPVEAAPPPVELPPNPTNTELVQRYFTEAPDRFKEATGLNAPASGITGFAKNTGKGLVGLLGLPSQAIGAAIGLPQAVQDVVQQPLESAKNVGGATLDALLPIVGQNREHLQEILDEYKKVGSAEGFTGKLKQIGNAQLEGLSIPEYSTQKFYEDPVGRAMNLAMLLGIGKGVSGGVKPPVETPYTRADINMIENKFQPGPETPLAEQLQGAIPKTPLTGLSPRVVLDDAPFAERTLVRPGEAPVKEVAAYPDAIRASPDGTLSVPPGAGAARSIQDFVQKKETPSPVFQRLNADAQNYVKDTLDNPKNQTVEFLNRPPEAQQLANSIVKDQIATALEKGADLSGFIKRNPSKFRQWSNYLKLQLADVGKRLGAEPSGGAIYQKLIAGNRGWGDELSALNAITEPAFKKLDNLKPLQLRDITQQIEKAVSTGDLEALKTPLAAEVYQAYQLRQQRITQVMQDAGLKTRKNYFTWNREGGTGNPNNIFQHDLPDEITSPHLKARKNSTEPKILDDIRQIADSHDRSVLRAIHYNPVVEFIRDLPEGTSDAAIRMVKKIIYPDTAPSGPFDWITNRRFSAQLKYNPFSGVENLSQSNLAHAGVSGEAQALASVLKEDATAKELGIHKFLNGSVSSQAEAVSQNRIIPEGGVFPPTEHINWKAARADGLAEEATRHPMYQKLRAKGVSRLEAFKAVKDEPGYSLGSKDFVPETVLERGYTRGEDLAAGSQFEQSKGFRPEIYEKAATTPFKVLTQFLRFDTSGAEYIKDLFTKKGRESTILRRGFHDEATPVLQVQGRRALLKGVELGKKEGSIAPDTYKTVKEQLQREIKDLDAHIKSMDTVGTKRKLKEVGIFSAKSTGAKGLKAAAAVGVLEALQASGILPEDKNLSLKDRLISSLLNQIPGQGTAKFLSGLAAGSAGDDPTSSSLTNLGLSLIPGVGEINGTIPGRPLTKIVETRVNKPLKKKLR